MKLFDWFSGKSSSAVAEPPAPSVAPKPAITGGETLTLHVKDEQTARNICNDQYFLLGILMSTGSSDAQRFLAAMRSGGTYRYEVRRNSMTGECDVKLMMK